MRKHYLKTDPAPFHDMAEGRKTFELRRDDRAYAVGDVLILREFEPGNLGRGQYTWKHLVAEVVYVLPGGRYGLDPSWSALGFRLLHRRILSDEELSKIDDAKLSRALAEPGMWLEEIDRGD